MITSVLLTVGALLVAAPAPVGEIISGSPSPVTDITRKMTLVSFKLAQEDTGEPVRKKQSEILSDLDELIAALEKECAACRGGIKRNNPSKPMADSMLSRGLGGIGALVPPEGGSEDWSSLSERERDRILQSMSEGFPPEYRTVLERYYRRLAEERGAEDSETPEAPETETPAEPTEPKSR